MNPYQQGRLAHAEGKTLWDNPHPPSDFDSFRWNTGFQASFGEMQEHYFGDAGAIYRECTGESQDAYHSTREAWLAGVSNGLDAMLLKLRSG